MASRSLTKVSSSSLGYGKNLSWEGCCLWGTHANSCRRLVHFGSRTKKKNRVLFLSLKNLVGNGKYKIFTWVNWFRNKVVYIWTFLDLIRCGEDFSWKKMMFLGRSMVSQKFAINFIYIIFLNLVFACFEFGCWVEYRFVSFFLPCVFLGATFHLSFRKKGWIYLTSYTVHLMLFCLFRAFNIMQLLLNCSFSNE